MKTYIRISTSINDHAGIRVTNSISTTTIEDALAKFKYEPFGLDLVEEYLTDEEMAKLDSCKTTIEEDHCMKQFQIEKCTKFFMTPCPKYNGPLTN